MNLLPVRIVPLAAEIPPGALVQRLRLVVDAGLAAPFTGTVGADTFTITRMNEFRSTIMPLMHGTLEAKPGGGTAVVLRLRPHRTVIVFMGIWLAFLAAAAAMIVLAHGQDSGRSLLLLLAPAGLGSFSWYLMNAVFATDARWALERLVESVPALHPDEIR